MDHQEDTFASIGTDSFLHELVFDPSLGLRPRAYAKKNLFLKNRNPDSPDNPIILFLFFVGFNCKIYIKKMMYSLFYPFRRWKFLLLT